MPVAGAGSFGKNHLRVIRQTPGTELVAVADTDFVRAQVLASEHECTAFTDYRDLIGRVDAVVIATPTTLHAEIGCALMEAGIDVGRSQSQIIPIILGDNDRACTVAAGLQQDGFDVRAIRPPSARRP